MKRLCQGVLFVLLGLPGCYDSHGAGARDGGARDAGRVFEAGRPDVPFTALDASSAPDAPSACPLLRPDATCLESFALIAGRPFELPFQYDTCGCCIETSCDVAMDVGARTLRLSTGLCPDPCDCDACVTPRGTCAVPAIPVSATGQWTVEVNGTVAFSIGVVEDEPGLVPGPSGCATYAEIDECGGGVPSLTTGPVTGDICVHVQDRFDRRVLTLESRCWSCGQIDSECRAIVSERLTDDLPAGGDITLHARDYWTACDVDCPEVCIDHVRECDLPPLDPGSFYRVFVDGRLVHSFVEGGASTTCEP